MRMGRAQRRRERPGRALDESHATTEVWEDVYSLGEECDAILSGRYQEWCELTGLPLHPWTYLNRAAHGSWSRLEAVTPLPVSSGAWPRLQVLVEGLILERVRPADLPDLQRDVLIPIELALQCEVMSPRQAWTRVADGIV
jgi:hypothetical protein